MDTISGKLPITVSLGYNERMQSGQGAQSSILGLAVLGVLIWGGVAVYHHLRPDYSKPWWSGTSDESVCQVVNNSLGSCYTIPLVSNGTEITGMVWPNGGTQSAGDTTCSMLGAGTSTPAKWFCDFSDSQGRSWETTKNL